MHRLGQEKKCKALRVGGKCGADSMVLDRLLTEVAIGSLPFTSSLKLPVHL
jgi:hypothetical protein